MKFSRSILALLLLTLITCSGIIGTASATTPSVPMDPTIIVNDTDGNKSIVDTLQDTFTRVIDLVVDIFLAPFNAISDVFSNWSDTLANYWYAPLIAVAVIILIIIMIRLYSEFDEFLDLNS